MTFKFAGAKSQVCRACNFVVARSDQGLQATGRMADLLQIATPLELDATGKWNGELFEVVGRIQMDRAGAPGAPWQETLLWFPHSDRYSWVAYAQGRWYATSEVPPPSSGFPPFEALAVGGQGSLAEHGTWVVQELGQRRVVSGAGMQTNVPAPGVITRYADLSGPGGAFGTIDYGDGSEQPVLYLGKQFAIAEMVMDATGMPPEMPEAKVSQVECPNCGGNLPLMSQSAERIVCQYCGTASDVAGSNLQMLGPAPPPPIQPYIPLGARGNLRGYDMIVVGFVIRSCMVEGVVYSWREYLLFGGDTLGYQWLMEEDGKWQHVLPIEAGDVMDSGHQAMFHGAQFALSQEVQAKVDYVVGEFYWKVEIGETVTATEFAGPTGKVSRERTETEVNYSFVTPLNPQELAAFGVAPPMAMGGMQAASGGGCSKIAMLVVVIVAICLVFSVVIGSMSDGSSSSRTSGGTSGGSGTFYYSGGK